jgi:lysophospholipase L1-like esterase
MAIISNTDNISGKPQETEYKNAIRAMLLKSIYEKKTRYRMLNKYAVKGQIVFTGSSLMESFPIDELQHSLKLDKIIYNRGLAGATTAELLDAMNECVFDLEPTKIFINIGSNDIGAAVAGGYQLEKLLENYNEIMNRIHSRLPECRVYVMAYYPVNAKDEFGLDKYQKKEIFASRTNEKIQEANKAIELLAYEHNFNYIDVNRGLTDEEGDLKKEFTMEGLHLWPNAYAVILENLIEYLY